MEGIHAETYSLMIDTLVKDADEKHQLLNAVKTLPNVQKKYEWSLKWFNDTHSIFSKRLIAFAIIEGIFFSGSFCAIFWLKQRGLMSGLTTSNEFISRDEGLHTNLACLLYNKYIIHKIDKQEVYDMIREAVEIEKEFICGSLSCRLIGMNQELMSEYIEFVSDRLLVQLGYDKIYKTKNPFDFMERISLEGKDNFFEKRVSNYSKSGIGRTRDDMSFGIDGDF
jgi:ribonucleotide reductase beta subunit family protein with ferritin-like domain